MKLKTIILSLALAFGTLCAASQDLETLTREQARELIDMVCRKTSVSDNSDMENVTGITGISVTMRVVDDNVVMKYTIPQYVGYNTPECKAYTAVLISGGGAAMSRMQHHVFAEIYRKAGYNIRAIYTDGAEYTCTLDLTPDRIEKLWGGDFEAAGIDPRLAREGLVRSFGIEKENDVATLGNGTYSVRLDDRWVCLTLILDDISALNTLSTDQIRTSLLREYSATPVISKMAGAMINAADFMKLDGLKVIYKDKNGDLEPIYLTWADLMNNI